MLKIYNVYKKYFKILIATFNSDNLKVGMEMNCSNCGKNRGK